MNNLSLKCEETVRKIFQCGRYQDPLSNLANADSWDGLKSPQFSKGHCFKVWAVLSRLVSQYLVEAEGRIGREEFYEKAMLLKDNVLNATTNSEIIEIMNEIIKIVDHLNLSEFPHISYKATNDNRLVE